MEFLPTHEFTKCVRRYHGDYRRRTFSCYSQFLCMAFAQLTYRESLRDVITCLEVLKPKLYHAGIRGKVSRSTLAGANEKRDWRICADFAQVLIAQARSLYASEDFGVELDNTVYALDASTIDLCLSLFPWARFRKAKGAVKLHTLLNLRGNIPEFIHISDGKLHDVNILDIPIPEAGSIYVMSIYVLAAIVKKRLGLDQSLYTILQILSVGLFEKTPIIQAFSTDDATNEMQDPCNQLELFNF